MLSRFHLVPLLLGAAALGGSCSVPDRATNEVRPAGQRVVTEAGSVSYSYVLPEGWESAPDEGALFGVRTLIFEKGTSFREGISVMYVAEPCTSDCVGKLGEMVAVVLASAGKDNPDLVVEDAEPLPTRSGPAEVHIVSGSKDARQAREALAFVGQPEIVLLFVLSTSDVSRWDRDYRAFAELLRDLEFQPATGKL
jgi:hypothetical protein